MIKRTTLSTVCALALLLVAPMSLGANDDNLSTAAEPSGSSMPPGNHGDSLDQKSIDKGELAVGQVNTQATRVEVPEVERAKFENWALPSAFAHQWFQTDGVLRQRLFEQNIIAAGDEATSNLSLKEAIYLAIRNNPGLQADRLEPFSSSQSVRQSEAVFDPDLKSMLEETKSVTAATSKLSTGGAPEFVEKKYGWKFGASKLLSSTNGTLGISFDNERVASNSLFWAVNPAYNPGMTFSLSQPLLRDFGLKFATIKVNIAKLNQQGAQSNFEQKLSDFVFRVAGDYWNVIRAAQNLQVAVEGLKLTSDLAHQNQLSFSVGMMSELDVKEAQSEAATHDANVFAAQDSLAAAGATLRQDVMLNDSDQLMPRKIEPSDKPESTEDVATEEEQALELATQYRPELESMRRAFQAILLQTRYAENQTLPQLTMGAQIGLSSTAGTAICEKHFIPGAPSTCITASGAHGQTLPFDGVYSDALDRLWGFKFYNYALMLNFEQPLMNDAAKAALAQARIQLEQQRLRYRDQVGQVLAEVQTALSQLGAASKRVHATTVAAEYAQDALRAEEARHRAGVAATHELLQFQDQLVSAHANQVNAQIDLEMAKLALLHAEGTLLKRFQINLAVQDTHATPWYATF